MNLNKTFNCDVIINRNKFCVRSTRTGKVEAARFDRPCIGLNQGCTSFTLLPAASR